MRVRCDTATAHKVKVVKQKHTNGVVQTSGIETDPNEKIPNHTRLMGGIKIRVGGGGPD